MHNLTSLSYFLVYFNTKSLDGNLYVNITIIGFAEILFGLVSGFLIKRCGADKAFMFACITCGGANFFLAFAKT